MLRIILFSALVSGAALISASAQDVEFGPGGVRIEPWHRHHGREHYCRELREACLRKEELGEEGRGNCRRYRAECGDH